MVFDTIANFCNDIWHFYGWGKMHLHCSCLNESLTLAMTLSAILWISIALLLCQKCSHLSLAIIEYRICCCQPKRPWKIVPGYDDSLDGTGKTIKSNGYVLAVICQQKKTLFSSSLLLTWLEAMVFWKLNFRWIVN